MKSLPITIKLFLIYLLVAALPLLGLTIWYVITFDHSLRQTELLNIDNIASKKAKQVETYLSQRMLDAEQLHDSSLIRESLESFEQAYWAGGFNSVAYRTVEDKLRTELIRHISNSVYWDLLLIDRNGNVVFSVAQEPDLGTNLRTGPYRTTQLAAGFNDAIRRNQTFLTKFYPYEPSQNRTAAFITAPVLNKKGILLGALALQLNLDRLDSVVGDKTGLGESGTTILAQLDKNQVLFIDSNKQASKNGFQNHIPLSQAAYAIQKSLQGDNGKTITKDYAGTEVIAAWRYLPSLDMGMVTKVDTREALASSTHIHNLSAILFTLIIISSGLIAYWFGRKLTRSVTSISNAAERIIGGDLTYRAPALGSDELGNMASSFNTMADQLLDAQQHLEDKVADRTEKLQSISNLQQAILDNASYGIIVTTPEGIITQFNYAAERMLGYKAEDVIGQFTPCIFHDPIELAERSHTFSKELDLPPEPGFSVFTAHAQRNLPSEFEWTYVRKDHSRFPVQLSVSMFRNSNGTIVGYLSIAIDISERKKTEEQQHIITERLNDAQHIACIGNWELDTLANELYWSDEIFNLFEINPDNATLSYETFINVVHPEDRDQVNQVYSNSIKNRIPYDITHRILMPDGRIKWMQERCRTDYNSNGEPIRSRGTVQDVTMQKNMEISLAQFASIVTSSEDAIVCNSLNGIITNWNPAAERIFGYQAHEVINHTMTMLLPPNRINENSQILARIACGEYVDHFESIRIRKDGTPINISASISPLRDGNGNIIGASQIIRDITKTKATETALIEAKLEADAANKAKSNFLANMSHEIRTPLNGILGMIQLVMNDGLKPQQNNYLHKAYTSSTALLGILNDILDYSKIEAGRLEIEHIPIKIETLLAKVSDLFLMQIEEKGLEIFFNIDPDVPSEILGDPMRLAQVLNNLVGNSIKFTERGEINIHISLRSITSKTSILQFDVQDTGIGIDPTHSDLLFIPFSQSDNSITRKFGGTGLGLSISHKLVNLMGGEIGVTSALGQGSTFSFTITAELCHNHIKKFNSTTLNNRKVLVVDDHETSCRILESWLTAWGMDVHTTTSGEQALHLIKKAVRDGYPFDTILLDWTMPGMSGLNVAQWIDEKFQPPGKVHPMTIVMVTTHGMNSVQNLSDSIHIDGILEKPIIPSDLFNSLHGNELSAKNNPISNAQSNTSSLRFDGACILLVEDNTINQDVATTFLKKLGVEVTEANNGSEAIDWVQRKTFDAILMDVHMPVMDGIEATRLIRKLFPDKILPIIAMTAAIMQKDRDHCNAAGMVDFLVKPINPDELALCLGKWVKIDDTRRITNDNQNDGVKKPDATFPIPSENIPGFDFVQALARMNGNYELLARMLQFFAEAQTSTQEKLDEYLQTEAFQEAILLLHNLRGSASTIGAIELADAAHQLENELKNGAAPQSHPAFEKALHTTIDIIRSMNSVDKANTVISAESDVSRKDLYSLLGILTPYLRDGELIPDIQIQALYELSHRNVSAHSLTRLIYQIEQFDHKAALASIAELIPALEMEMSND